MCANKASHPLHKSSKGYHAVRMKFQEKPKKHNKTNIVNWFSFVLLVLVQLLSVCPFVQVESCVGVA